eukprot:3702000-Prymnesium_polylepis.1
MTSSAHEQARSDERQCRVGCGAKLPGFDSGHALDAHPCSFRLIRSLVFGCVVRLCMSCRSGTCGLCALQGALLAEGDETEKSAQWRPRRLAEGWLVPRRRTTAPPLRRCAR